MEGRDDDSEEYKYFNSFLASLKVDASTGKEMDGRDGGTEEYKYFDSFLASLKVDGTRKEMEGRDVDSEEYKYFNSLLASLKGMEFVNFSAFDAVVKEKNDPKKINWDHAALMKEKNDPKKINWDHATHMSFIDLCLVEVRNDNMTSGHFNRLDWKNLIDAMRKNTGRTFSIKQLQNHWDKMKKEWEVYDRLMRRESRLKWDPVKKTIDATPEWWAAAIQEDPEFAIFKGKNLEIYQIYYEPLFRDKVATGENAKEPNCYTGVEDNNEEVEIDDEVQKEQDTVTSTFPPSSQHKRPSTSSSSRSKKGKLTLVSTFEDKLDKVIEIMGSRSSATSAPPKSNIPSLEECVTVISEFPGYEPGSQAYCDAILLFWKEEARQSIMIPPTMETKKILLDCLIKNMKR